VAQKTDLNVSPYYDDFAEDKNFHRVLFKPSAAIQARELTQLQSILQNQIERFGSHMFKEGSIILGARTNYDNQYFGVRVEDTNPNGSGVSAAESFRADALNKFYKGQTSGVVGKVVNTSSKTTEDNLTLHVKYQATGNSGSTFFTEFQDGETLDEVTQDSNGLGGYTTASSNNQFKVFSIAGSTDVGSMVGSAANISEGIIYTRGNFVKVPAQTIILEKYSNTPSYKVGVDIAETLTTYTEDTSLLDNASGSSNENAPGADRLKFSLVLAKKSLTSTDSTDFIELMRLASGEVVRKQEITEYNRIQETLARRTFDESGDYTLQPFTLAFREHLNNLSNNGVYTSNSTPAGDDSKFITVVSSGKSYVRGFEVDKQTPSFLTFSKARTTSSKDNVASAFRIGNFLKINNVYGLPDISDTGDLKAFSTVTLMDTAKGSVASDDGGGNKIGFARVRAFEEFDSSIDAVHLFDVQMFTKLTTASVSLSKGMKVIGSVSGATGIVAEAVSSGTTVLVHSVVGAFNTSDTLRKIQNSSGGVSISAIRTFDIGRIRRIHQDRGTGTFQEFGGDTVLEDNFTLTGSAFGAVDGDSANDTITGVASKFTSELIEGDKLLFPDGSNSTVVSVTDNDTAIVSDLSASFNGTVVRQRAKFYKPDQTVAISGLPNSGIKDITIETEIVRREVLVQSSGSGVCTVTSSDGTFVAFSEDDYHAARSDTGAKIALGSGQVAISNGSNSGTVNITVGVNSTVCKVIVTVQRGSVDESTKSLVKGGVLAVNTANSTSNYSTSYQHTDITLGVSDVYAVRGIFEGGNAISSGGAAVSTSPVPPSFTYTADSGSNALSTGGVEVIGDVSNARGILIENDSNVCYFYYKQGSVKFQSGEGITFTDGTAKAGTITNLSNGSKEITDNFLFDDGQRDGFYDVSKISRKKGAPAPTNPLMVIVDFFTHSGGGNVFTGKSYGTLAFDEVPSYVADRFDPSASFDADGEFHLADSIDYRPVAARLLTTQPTNDISSPQNISGISAIPQSYSATVFEGNGSFNPDLAKIGSNITVDYSHFLARVDRVFLTALGEFVVVTGEPSDVPKKGAKVDNAIEVAEIFIPAFTPDVGQIETQLVQHRRYTMRDIDGIQRRLTQLETAVSLSMLEEKTETLQVLDDDGFDKFKSGFVVDPFKGHGVGDVFHPDYGISVDQREGIARPSHRTNYFDLQYNTGISSNITKSGDLLTLPFTEEAHITSNKASRQVNVNPYDVANFVGRLELSPDKDVWHDMEQLPSITSSQEGNFDAVLAGVEVGTVWNDWQQTWVGVPSITQRVGNFLENNNLGDEPEEFELLRGRRFRRRRQVVNRGRGRVAINTTTTRTIPTRDNRSGIVTNVVEDITTTRNDRVVGVSAINFMRTIDITLSGELLKPNTALNVFFDNINVNAHCTPASATYGVSGGTSKGTKLVTDSQGKLNATFTVPNNDTLRFETGVRTLKVTDTTAVDSLLSTTSAFSNFMANGSLTSTQTEVVSTRNGRIVTESVNEARSNQLVDVTATTRWVDPLAQSFLVEKEEGIFVNSIEVFFGAKDGGGLPVTCSIRQMLNGSPTQKVLPFAEKTLYPSEISVSANAQTATKFSFPSPVYLNPNTEYCFVLESNSNAYLSWVGQMGDFDVHTKEPIDRQPYAGVLFKSQNSSTWTPEQLQDLKFNINRCKFSSSSGKVVLENKDIPSKKLKNNPIEIVGSSDRDRVKIYHQSHGMYDGDSNVTISGVEGDKDNGILTVTSSVSGTGATGTYAARDESTHGLTPGGDGEGMTFDIILNTNTSISSIKINNPGYNFAVNETITIPQSAVGGSGATTFATITVASLENTLGGIPISKINTTHTAIQSFDLDSYEVNVSLGNHVGGTDNVRGGGVGVNASENMYYDVIHTLVPNVIYPKTSLGSEMFKTSTNQPQGTGNSYSLSNASQTIVLNDNNFMTTSGIVASSINETNEMGSAKSFKLELDMTTTSDFVSPIVDVGSIGANTIMNRIDSISSSSDVANNTTFVPSEEPAGDNNASIYCTRLIQLENPATQLKVIFDGFKPAGTALGEIKTYFKLLKADNTLPTEELGWTEFGTDNVPDADSSKFRSYEYDASNLEEFLGFAVKIVMKSKDTTQPCAIRAFRGLALA
jgi:hypothetical protein